MSNIANYNKTNLKDKTVKKVEEKLSILTFRIKNNIYGIDIKYVDSVANDLTKSKGEKEKNLYSMVSYRENIIPLLDLYTYLYGSTKEQYKEVSNNQIIVKVNESKLGLEVSEIKDIVEIDKKHIIDVIPLLRDRLYMVSGFVQMGDELISIINIEEIFKFVSNS